MAPGIKKKPAATEVVNEIRHRTRRVFLGEERIKIVVEGLLGEDRFRRFAYSHENVDML